MLYKILSIIERFLQIIMIKLKSGLSIDSCKKVQSFSRFATEYYLEEETHELCEKATPKDIVEYVNSFKDVALSVVLDKFLPSPVDDESVGEQSLYAARRDLHLMSRVIETAEQYRDKFGLPDTMSTKDIFTEVGKYADALKKRLEGKGNDEKKTPAEESK